MAQVTRPIAQDDTLRRIATALEAQTHNQNFILLPIGEGADAITLNPATAVYRVAPTPDGTTVVIPTPDASAIGDAPAYYCFELEVAVDASATTLAAPPSGETFDAETAYAVGDYVIHDDEADRPTLWRCTAAHEGDWDADDFEEVAGAPVSWTWLVGGKLPTSNFAGKTLYIACRMDCTSRAVVANVWREQ